MKTLVVSCYYKINSKHPAEKYMGWIDNFMTLNFECAIFVNQESYTILNSKYPENGKRRYIIKEFEHFETSKWDWSYDEQIDHEINVGHNRFLYQIWNEKIFFVNDAISKFPEYEYFIWMDIGSFRMKEHLSSLSSFPNVRENREKLTFGIIEQFDISEVSNLEKVDERYRYSNRISGSSFGGDKIRMLKFKELHENMINEFKQNKVFCGKDQSLFAFEFLRNQELFEFVKNINPQLDPWFILQYFWS